MLDHSKIVAKHAELDPAKFDMKIFRSTYASRTLRTGFDVRTVQHCAGNEESGHPTVYIGPHSRI